MPAGLCGGRRARGLPGVIACANQPEARRAGGPRASRRVPRRACQIIGVERLATERTDGGSAHGEFHQIGFCNDQRPGGAQAGHQKGIPWRNGSRGGHPIVGNPIMSLPNVPALSVTGIKGLGFPFVNYADEPPFFCQEVLQRLERLGLRVSAGGAAGWRLSPRLGA